MRKRNHELKWCPGCCQPMSDYYCWCRSCHKEVLNKLHNQPMPKCNPPNEDVTTCTFHIFFPFILETDEHIRLLTREAKNSQKKEPKHATSKITTTNLATIEPVNRVAARV